jgi:hypothetical protein
MVGSKLNKRKGEYIGITDSRCVNQNIKEVWNFGIFKLSTKPC